MTIKLIKVNPKQEIGEIKLSFLPRPGDHIHFKGKIYTLNSAVHSETLIELIVTDYQDNSAGYFTSTY